MQCNFCKKKPSICYCLGITDKFLILMKTCCYTFLHCILKVHWSLNFGQEGYDKVGLTKFPECKHEVNPFHNTVRIAKNTKLEKCTGMG